MFKIEFPKKNKNFIKHGTEPDPNFYWIIVFFTGFAFTVAAFVFGFYVFLKINKDEVLPPVVLSKQLEKVSKNRIDKILGIFKEREKNSSEISEDTFKVTDPSL